VSNEDREHVRRCQIRWQSLWELIGIATRVAKLIVRNLSRAFRELVD